MSVIRKLTSDEINWILDGLSISDSVDFEPAYQTYMNIRTAHLHPSKSEWYTCLNILYQYGSLVGFCITRISFAMVDIYTSSSSIMPISYTGFKFVNSGSGLRGIDITFVF